ncbi:MAG: molybdopterin converting factor subunit 1 [Hyphomicrobiaceae bacterium]|nr:MAG: molybdopterin converting factor subunit 1 [Hyphomicrobiaceae bacterium]
MPVKLLYFAWVREKAGRAEETVDLPDGIDTVADLMAWQKTRGPEMAAAFERMSVIRAAIDQQHAPHSAAIAGAREIAFFPPVTGG